MLHPELPFIHITQDERKRSQPVRQQVYEPMSRQIGGLASDELHIPETGFQS
jgi:hypothetical protein